MHSYEREVGPSMASWVGYITLETLINVFIKLFDEDSPMIAGDKLSKYQKASLYVFC